MKGGAAEIVLETYPRWRPRLKTEYAPEEVAWGLLDGERIEVELPDSLVGTPVKHWCSGTYVKRSRIKKVVLETMRSVLSEAVSADAPFSPMGLLVRRLSEVVASQLAGIEREEG